MKGPELAPEVTAIYAKAWQPVDTLMLRYHAANRDRTLFSEPNDLDIDRGNAQEQIAFGQGIHFCPGASWTV